MATAGGTGAVGLGLVGTMRADALNEVLRMQDLESLWYLYRRDFLCAEAEGAATDGAGEVDVLALLVGLMMIVVVCIGMLVFVTDAVFLLSAAIVDGVEQVAFDEEHQGAEEGASVHGG